MADEIKQSKYTITAEEQLSVVLDALKKKAQDTFSKISAEMEKTGTASQGLLNEYQKLQRQASSVDNQIKSQGKSHETLTQIIREQRSEHRLLTFAMTAAAGAAEGLATDIAVLTGATENHQKQIKEYVGGLRNAVEAGTGMAFALKAMGGSFAAFAGPVGIAFAGITALAEAIQANRKAIQEQVEFIISKWKPSLTGMDFTDLKSQQEQVQQKLAAVNEQMLIFTRNTAGGSKGLMDFAGGFNSSYAALEAQQEAMKKENDLLTQNLDEISKTAAGTVQYTERLRALGAITDAGAIENLEYAKTLAELHGQSLLVLEIEKKIEDIRNKEIDTANSGIEVIGAQNIARSSSLTTLAELHKHESDLKLVMDAVNITTKEGQAYFKKLNDELEATKAKIEHVELAARGLSETHFDLKLKIQLDEATADPKSFGKEIRKKIEESFSLGGAIKSPLFGVPAVTSEDNARINDQVELARQLRQKERALFKDEKDYELDIIEEWERTAIDMAHGNEDEITRIKRVAAGEREKIEVESLQDFQRQFDQWANIAQQAAGVVSQAVSNSYGAEIDALQSRENAALAAIEQRKKKEIDAIEQAKKKEIDAINARLASDKLTTAQRNALTAKRSELEQSYSAQEATVSKKYDEEKAARQAEYELQMKQAKMQEFFVNQDVQLVNAIINTAAAAIAGLRDGGPWLMAAYLALGAAETAVIAGQSPPSFHEGGVVPGGMDEEIVALLKGGETVRTVRQEQTLRETIREKSGVVYEGDHSVRTLTIPIYVSEAVTNPEAIAKVVKDGVQKGMRELGVKSVDEFFINNRAKVTL